MYCHIINKHRHTVQLTDVEFPLDNTYLVEAATTITFANNIRFHLYCPICKIGNYPGMSSAILCDYSETKIYFIEEFTVQENCWWVPCLDCDPPYLELSHQTFIDQNDSLNKFVSE